MKRTLFTTAQDTEAAFYEALEKADIEAMMAVWADDDDIVCVHPGGMRLAGVEQVRESWRQIFANGQTLRFRLRQLRTINTMTLAVHSVYEQITIAGETQPRQPIAATNIYMRTEKGWRMIAHHASPAPASPDGERTRKKILH
jgi:uncharacterized protein (TIGR02246 family)